MSITVQRIAAMRLAMPEEIADLSQSAAAKWGSRKINGKAFEQLAHDCVNDPAGQADVFIAWLELALEYAEAVRAKG